MFLHICIRKVITPLGIIKGETIKQNRKYFVVLFMALTFLITGCSNNKALLNDDGKEVSLGNKDVPTLVFFFTGNT